jgi:dihydrofolate synthase/folylpolyglutamate synthase
VESLFEALARLYERVPFGVRLGLDGMREACRAAGHPERAYDVVHVAGTNGKGSVSAMVAAIAKEHGTRTGLYTSPHLARFTERIQIDGEPIADDILAPLLSDTLTRAPDLTFFEVATLTALRAFEEAKVGLAVLEVGLGGRLDATNVVPSPRAAAITRIALDHTDRLGTTLDAIAREKAGIAKAGLEIVLGPLLPEARAAILEVARAAGATTTVAGDDPEAASFAREGRIGLEGAHQRENAEVAYVLGARIGASVAERIDGIAKVRWPGRLETVRAPAGDVLLDAAHNPDGIEALARHVAGLGVPPDRVAVVFGVLADKSWPEMLDRVARMSDHRFYVRPSGRPAVAPARLAERHAGHAEDDATRAVARARAEVGPSGLVVVCGSILLVGEVRALLLGLPRDPAVAL